MKNCALILVLDLYYIALHCIDFAHDDDKEQLTVYTALYLSLSCYELLFLTVTVSDTVSTALFFVLKAIELLNFLHR